MKIERLEVNGPIKGICRQPAIWGGEGNGFAPLVYLQRPKWIKDDTVWDKIVKGIRLELHSGFEVQ